MNNIYLCPISFMDLVALSNICLPVGNGSFLLKTTFLWA